MDTRGIRACGVRGELTFFTWAVDWSVTEFDFGERHNADVEDQRQFLRHQPALSASRRTEPAGVDKREVAVAITGAGIAGTVASGQCGDVRLVRRIDVEQGGRLVFDIHLRAAACRVRMILDVVETVRHVSVLFLVLEIVTVPLGRAIHLPKESGIGGIAVGGIRTVQPHRRHELVVAGIDSGDQMLLLLHHGEQHFLTHLAGTGRLVDDCRRRLAFAARIVRAQAFA